MCLRWLRTHTHTHTHTHTYTHTRVSVAVTTSLAVIGVVHLFTWYGECDYPHMPRVEIPAHLYLQVNPNLGASHLHLPLPLPPCPHEQVLNRRAYINSWEITKLISSFDPVGVVNGSWMPADCTPRISVALLVPHRDRQTHLDVFLPYMHHFLRQQRIHYKVYLIEQQDEAPWNKGVLLNTGARLAAADGWPCFILHDVDLLPLDAGNLYSCLQAPRHMSGAVDSLRLTLPYRGLVGGVLAVRADHYHRVQGLSDHFTGWGGEDDDFHNRMTRHGLQVLRFEPELSRYSMLPHRQSPRNPRRFALLAEGVEVEPRVRVRVRVQYTVNTYPMYTHVLVKQHVTS